MLKLDLRVGESVKVGEAIVTLESKSGNMARLSIDANKSVPIERINTQTTAAHLAKNGIGGLPVS